MSQVYCLLGSDYRQRLALAAYLARFGWDSESGPLPVLLPRHVIDNPEFASWLPPHARILPLAADWTEDDGWKAELPTEPAEALFLIPDRMQPPVEQLESLRFWLQEQGFELGRILTVIDCNIILQYPQFQEWYDACIHFSDGVLLSNHPQAPKKWLREYEQTFKKRHLPCLVGYLKEGGKVEKVDEWIFPEARRMSLYFEEEEEGQETLWEGHIAIEDGDEDEWEEDEENDPKPGDPDSDVYLARNEMGFRKRPVHDFRILIEQFPE